MNWRWAGFELAALAALSVLLPDAIGAAYVDARLRLAYAGIGAVVASSVVLQGSGDAMRDPAARCRRGTWASMAAFLVLMAADIWRIGRASNWVFLGWDAGPLARILLLTLGLTRLGAAAAVWATARPWPSGLFISQCPWYLFTARRRTGSMRCSP